MNSYLIDCHCWQRIYTSVIPLTAICASFTTVLMAQPEITLQADNAKAHWQDIKVDILLHYLIENWAASGDGRNFTMSTFNNAAAAINVDAAIQTIGPQKTGKMVKTKWTSLKKIFNQIEIYLVFTGIMSRKGAGIESTTAASVLDTYVDPKSLLRSYSKVKDLKSFGLSSYAVPLSQVLLLISEVKVYVRSV
ncbi:hypothetical protein BDR04DRAFT_122100 [Suillus decipiens]|nr:hypothetical protein BDR04DRAFT_122100 [Suillus decipiens]